MPTCSTCSLALADTVRFCPADGTAVDTEPLIGKVLDGQFRVLEKAGQGACGDVYRAWQLGVERQVAIKVMRPEIAQSAEYSARFTREARAAAQLTSPGIVRIYSLGHTAQKQPYIAMEWLEGNSLRCGIEGGQPRYTPNQITDIAKQLASALSEAHAAGIVHRDLKPDNILVRVVNSQPRITLLDFGIAKILDPDQLEKGESHLTKLGAVYGTPAYMSPEQAGGDSVDARSDLYSVGVILFELLSGQLPFQDEGLSLLVAHINGEIPDLMELNPSLPPALVRIVNQLLAKNPNERFQSAGALFDAIGGLSGEDSLVVADAQPVKTQFTEALPSNETRPLAPAVRRSSLFAAALALALMATGSVSLDIGDTPSATLAKPVVEKQSKSVVNLPDTQPTVVMGPRRAMMVSADGYSLRVLLPEEMMVDQSESVTIDLWGPDGQAIELPALVVVFTDADAERHGVSALPGTQPGRYQLSREFSITGQHSMQVLPEGGEVSLQVHFEVQQEPNS